MPQGTYLASSVQKDLDDMIDHREPAEAVHRIRVMHDALYNFKHDLLGAGAPGVMVSPLSWPRPCHGGGASMSCSTRSTNFLGGSVSAVPLGLHPSITQSIADAAGVVQFI